MSAPEDRSRSNAQRPAAPEPLQGIGASPQQQESRPPCQAGCPNCGDIRGWIGVIAQRANTGLSRDEAYARAWGMIADVNPFPSVLGRICPHPCESHCNRGDKDGSVSINAMERFLGDWAIHAELPLARLEEDPKPESIGVIGGGPAGLSFAYQMARRGYRVTVYDQQTKSGGMLRYGIPDYRLPPEVLDSEVGRILDLGVTLELGVTVGVDVSVEELKSRHQVLFLGIGAQSGRRLGVPGEDGDGVLLGTDFLGRVNRHEPVDVGQRVVVIGGGDTAFDAARSARRLGAEVTILYRRTREEMPAREEEVEETLEEGIRVEYLVAPTEVKRNAVSIKGLALQRMELGEPDASGRRRPVPIPDSEFEIPVDTVIAAISQEADWTGLEVLKAEGLWMEDDPSGGLDNGVLAGGDALGLGIAGTAIVQGRRAAEVIHARLRDLPPPVYDEREPVNSERIQLDYYETSAPAAPFHLPVEEALGEAGAEVHVGISEQQFIQEASRCFSCGSCFGCGHCSMYCTALCFTKVEEGGPGMYYALTLDQCEECGKCVEVCPSGFLQVAPPS